MRLFDAGPFHAGFGVIVTPDAETVDIAVESKTRWGRLPFRHSLAATLYGDQLRPGLPLSADQEAAFDMLQSLLERVAPPDAGPRLRPAAPRRKRPRRGRPADIGAGAAYLWRKRGEEPPPC